MNRSIRQICWRSLWAVTTAPLALAGPVPAPVGAWATQFERVESASLIWDMDRPVVSADEQTVTMLRADVFMSVRWPDAMDVRKCRNRQPTDAPALATDPFRERMVFTGSGELLLFMAQGSVKTVERHAAALDMAVDRSTFLDAAPLFAGKWLAAVGLPQQTAKVRDVGSDGFEISIGSTGVTLHLRTDAGSGRLVLGKVTFHEGSGPLLFQHEYSDFRPVTGCDALIGFRRRVTFEPAMMPPKGEGPEIPRVRDDVLIEAAVVPRLPDGAFQVSTAGFQEKSLRRGEGQQQLQPQIEPRIAPTPPKRSSLLGPSLTSFGIACLLAGGLLVTRRLIYTR